MAGPEVEERLRQAELALERSERLAVASRYAGAVMHEVNNPLEAITNLVYLTKLQKDEPEHVLENMLVVEEQLQLLGRVTREALNFHREQTDPRETDLVDIAESALKLHADKLLKGGIAVRKQFSGPVMANVYGSEILQVVSNLILNAIEVLPHAEGRIGIRISKTGQRVHLTITDNGPGIPEHFAARLFEPYLTSKSSGTGLGLWLSHRIIGKHRGTLRFRTCRKAGRRGTTFRISLPAARAA